MGLIQDLAALQQSVDAWYRESLYVLQVNHEEFMSQLQSIEQLLVSEGHTAPQEMEGARTPSGRSGWGERREDLGAGRALWTTPPRDAADLLDISAIDAKEADTHWLVVQFKRQRFFYGGSFALDVGEYVVVGGDRGEDIGRVVAVQQHWEGPPRGCKEGPGKALRRATAAEVQLMRTDQREAENEAVAVAAAATLKYGLDMAIVDAEYQFDRRKLTFYYESALRPDFRHLIRELYQRFHARIWMEKAKG